MKFLCIKYAHMCVNGNTEFAFFTVQSTSSQKKKSSGSSTCTCSCSHYVDGAEVMRS